MHEVGFAAVHVQELIANMYWYSCNTSTEPPSMSNRATVKVGDGNGKRKQEMVVFSHAIKLISLMREMMV